MRLFRFTIIMIVLIASARLLAQWSEPRRVHIGGSLTPLGLLVQGDTLHCAYTSSPGRTKITYVRSTDQGDSWSSGVVLNDTINYSNAYYPCFITLDSRLIAIWLEMQREGFQLWYISYATSEDGGITWENAQHALNPGIEGVDLFSAAASDSTINILYTRLFLSRMRFNLIRSTNFGETWTSPHEIFDCEQTSFSDMVAYGDNFHFVWTGNFEQGINWELYYSRSIDKGLTWSEPETLTTPGDRGARHASLSINEAGEIGMCWTDFRYAPPGWIADLFFARSLDQGESWQGETQLTFIHQDERSDIVYVGDTVHVAFQRGYPTTKKICYTRSIDDGVTWEQEVELDLDPADSHDPKVGYGNGRTYVFWCDERENPDTAGYGGLYFCRYPAGDTVGITGDKSLPGSIGLTAYPNPFNSATTISFSGLDGNYIKIYDITGSLVKTLDTDNNSTGAVNWDATDDAGQSVCSGVYFIRAQTPEGRQNAKVIYLK